MNRIVYIVLLVGLVGCGPDSKPTSVELGKEQRTEKGLVYTFFEDAEGENARIGDIIEFDLLQTDQGKEQINTFNRQYPGYMPRALVDYPGFDGDYMEGLAMLSVGDSVEFVVDKTRIPQLNQSGEMRFLIKVRAIWNEDELIESMISTSALAEKERTITENGLVILWDKKSESPAIAVGDKVNLVYKTLLYTGVPVDTTNTPVEVVAGVDETMPPAIGDALTYLNYGDKVTLIAPYRLGYGAVDRAPILKYSTLVFEMDILDKKE